MKSGDLTKRTIWRAFLVVATLTIVCGCFKWLSIPTMVISGLVEHHYLSPRHLISALEDDDSIGYLIAINQLAQCDAPSLEALADALAHGTPSIRRGAAVTLGRIGTEDWSSCPYVPDAVFEELHKALSDTDLVTSAHAALALSHASRDHEKVLQVLRELQRSSNSRAKYIASVALEEIRERQRQTTRKAGN
jgi:HEAT repeat protein